MKKLILFTLTTFGYLLTNAQGNIYGSVSSGNKTSSWCRSYRVAFDANDQLPDGYLHEMKLFLSKGTNGTGAIGYQKDQFKIELGFTFLKEASDVTERDDQRVIGISSWGFAYEYSKLHYKTTTQMFSVKPKAFYRFKETKLSPYVSLGLDFSTIDLKYNNTQEFHNKLQTVNARLYNGLTWGHQLNFGLDFKANDKIQIFADIGYINHQYKPKNLDIFESVQNYESGATEVLINKNNVEIQSTSSTDIKKFNLLNTNFGISYTLKTLQ